MTYIFGQVTLLPPTWAHLLCVTTLYVLLYKGIARGGSDGSDESPFQWQNFVKLKITPNHTALQ